MARDDHALPADRLETRFHDERPPLSPAAARAEARRCLYCHDAPCTRACPTRIDVATFVRRIATGDPKGSARAILEANLLGASCARACPVEVLCEGACVYVPWGRQPIAIGRLQRHAMEHASPGMLEKAPPTGHSVGLVGAGPASLACAGTLALLGHAPAVYERDPLPGGLNTTGVAPYKMGAAAALAEVGFVRALGVTIETGRPVDVELVESAGFRRHAAVFLGVGLGGDAPLRVPGADGPGVVGALAWIRSVKTSTDASVEGVRRAVVVGGGNTAVDAARELLGLGVPDVRLVHRRSEDGLRAYAHEWERAQREGCVLVPRAVVTEVSRSGGRVTGVRLAAAGDGARPAAGLPADLVVVAIGQDRLLDVVSLFPGVEVDGRGRIVADPETGATGNPRVFAGGDAANGGREVVHAVDDGQRAARAIDRLLRAGGRAGG